VGQFAEEADRQVIDALTNAELEQPGHPLLDGAEAVYTILEHEAMHQETLLYMWHRLPFAQKTPPPGARSATVGVPPRHEWIAVPGGCATLGVDRSKVRFGWDNEFPALAVPVAPFSIERHDVTNARFLEFVEGGGYRDERWWTSESRQWLRAESIAHPLFWERDGGEWRGGGACREPAPPPV